MKIKKKNKIPFIQTECCEKYQSRIEKLKPIFPDDKFYSFDTIKWLIRSQSKESLKKSINSLIEKPKQKKKSKSFSKYKQKKKICIVINPKYFCTKTTFEKILKLKELFLDFDKDRNSKMEIGEITNMFNINGIPATTEDIKQLIFKNKQTQKLFLNFYQFVQFSLQSDYDFRLFMREQKKIQKNSKNNTNYLPMNFNLLLDYFIAKGEERKSIQKIKSSINSIGKLINENQKNVSNLQNFVKLNEEIQVNNIMEEFSKLFNLTTNFNKEERDSPNKEKHFNKHKLLNCKGMFSNVIKHNIDNHKFNNIQTLPEINTKKNNFFKKKINHYHQSSFCKALHE